MLNGVASVAAIALLCGCSQSSFEKVNYNPDGGFKLACKNSRTGIGSPTRTDGVATRLVGLKDQLCQQAPDEWTFSVEGQSDKRFRSDLSVGIDFSCDAARGGDPFKERVMAAKACAYVVHGEPL